MPFFEGLCAVLLKCGLIPNINLLPATEPYFVFPSSSGARCALTCLKHIMCVSAYDLCASALLMGTGNIAEHDADTISTADTHTDSHHSNTQLLFPAIP